MWLLQAYIYPGCGRMYQVTLEKSQPNIRGDFRVGSDQPIHERLSAIFRICLTENFGILRISVGPICQLWRPPDVLGTLMKIFQESRVKAVSQE